MVLTTSSSKVVAPKIPPSILTESQVAAASETSLAAVPSSTRQQSNPLSIASRIVVDTQTSVVTPATIKFLMPLMRRRSSKSVWAKAPRPGLSMMGSPSMGYSSGIMSWPGSPRINRRPRGPSEPMPRPEALLRERNDSRLDSVERSGRWPMHMWGRDSARAGASYLRECDRRGTMHCGRCREDVASLEWECGLGWYRSLDFVGSLRVRRLRKG